MTNFEKYKDEIIKIFYEKGSSIAREKNTGRIVCCDDISCVQCQFSLGSCVINMFEWMLKEYQDPAPKLTKAERGFCEIVQKGWLSRDRNNILIYQSSLPEYVEVTECIEIPKHHFNFITWESGKAWSIEDLLKLEVEE